MYDVIVASRAGDSMIPDALASIHSQTLAPNRVVVVIDRGSEIPQPWWVDIESRFPKVELLRQPGVGMASAVSAGIRHMSSPYLAFLDTDDLWRPEKQALQVAALEAAQHVDAVTCSARNVSTLRIGLIEHKPAFPCATFTATTFRAATFRKFGLPDPTATHHGWLYRWWSNARRHGIRSEHAAYLGLERRIHGGNSWCVENTAAHRALLAELRTSVGQRRRPAESADVVLSPSSQGHR